MTDDRNIITALAAAVMLLFCGGTALGSTSGQPVLDKNALPFLINGRLPHLTGMLMKQWDNPELGLTDQQKRWLKVVREETIADVKRLTSEVATLEKQVVDGINSGLEPDDLYPAERPKRQPQESSTPLQCLFSLWQNL